MVSMSAAGSTRLSTWTTFSSSKQRTTWAIASHSRMLRQERVALALALARAAHQAGDVDEVDRGGHRALGLDDLAQRVEARVGHRHDADVGLDGAERVVRGLGLLGGQRVEERGLADVGQTDDADRESHSGVR